MALVNNPLFARYFARFGGRNEDRGNRELRQEMLAGLSRRFPPDAFLWPVALRILGIARKAE